MRSHLMLIFSMRSELLGWCDCVELVLTLTNLSYLAFICFQR